MKSRVVYKCIVTGRDDTIFCKMNSNAKDIVDSYKYELLAIQDTIDIISGKWKMQIMALVCSGEFRFSELAEALPKITPKMLSKELKDLEQNQLIDRTVHEGSQAKVTYTLSKYGYTMVPLIAELTNWGKAHRRRMYGLAGTSL